MKREGTITTVGTANHAASDSAVPEPGLQKGPLPDPSDLIKEIRELIDDIFDRASKDRHLGGGPLIRCSWVDCGFIPEGKQARLTIETTAGNSPAPVEYVTTAEDAPAPSPGDHPELSPHQVTGQSSIQGPKRVYVHLHSADGDQVTKAQGSLDLLKL